MLKLECDPSQVWEFDSGEVGTPACSASVLSFDLAQDGYDKWHVRA